MKKIIVILGPTATGKTDLAVKLAKKFNGEIVSADSRQIFRNMDIGTAKPAKHKKLVSYQTPLFIKGIPHYLIDIFKPGKEINVAIYKRLALKLIKDMAKRGKLPFLVGGTGLYIKAVVDNLDFPKVIPSKNLRKALEAKTKNDLFELYKRLDPKGAKLIDKNNKRRLVRAIEVCLITKRPFWQQRNQKKPLFKALQIGIKLPKSVLNKNISVRTDKMMRLGLEKEIKMLFRKYGNLLIFSQTIGYQEWLPFLKSRIDSQTRKKIAEEIKNHTRQYAKRQLVWFKKHPAPVPLKAGRYEAGSRIRWISSPRLYQKAEKLVKNFLNHK